MPDLVDADVLQLAGAAHAAAAPAAGHWIELGDDEDLTRTLTFGASGQVICHRHSTPCYRLLHADLNAGR